MVSYYLISDNSNITNTETQHGHNMTTITNRILKFKPVTKKLIVTDNTLFTGITFSRIIFFT